MILLLFSLISSFLPHSKEQDSQSKQNKKDFQVDNFAFSNFQQNEEKESEKEASNNLISTENSINFNKGQILKTKIFGFKKDYQKNGNIIKEAKSVEQQPKSKEKSQTKLNGEQPQTKTTNLGSESQKDSNEKPQTKSKELESKSSKQQTKLREQQIKSEELQSEITDEKEISFQDYSNDFYENLQESIYINDNYQFSDITNSQFINFEPSENQEEFLFIVQKEFIFYNVKFMFNKDSKTKYGAIKVECKSDVIIQNCEFIRCNGKNTIFFASTPKILNNVDDEIQSRKTIDNCTFIECGSEESEFVSVLSEPSSSGIQIDTNGQFNIIKTIFDQTNSVNSAIFYNPSSASTSESNYLNIDGCIFQKCIGGCIYISTETGSIEEVNIQYNTFEECVNIDHNDISCIKFGSNTDSISLTIEGNMFEHCNNQSKDSILILLQINNEPVTKAKEKQIEIINNTIDYDFNFLHFCKLALLIEQPNRDILIHNCSFTNCNKYSYGSWSNTIYAEKLSKLTISECKFNQCGFGYSEYEEINTTTQGGNVIGIGSLGGFNTLVLIQNCTFVRSSSPVSSYTESISLIGNTIIECCRNSFRITHRAGEVGKGFELIENKFLNLTTGCVIHIWSSSIMYCPTIRGNIFEHNRIEEGGEESNTCFLFKLEDMSTIVFDNNTFRDIQTKKGGFTGKFECSSESVNLTFVNCLFEYNSQTTNGGAFCSSNEYNGGNIYLTFEECHFKNNEVDANGGSLFVSSNKDVNINHCIFESNKATDKGGSIYIEHIGGQLIINDCQFKDNSATEGQAIYGIDSIGSANLLEETRTRMKIDNCTFIDCGDKSSNAFTILLNNGNKYEVTNSLFINSTGGVKVSEDVQNALINNCTFFDCYSTTAENNYMAVVIISNKECVFTNNNISFSSSDDGKSITGLLIEHHGQIEVRDNLFYKVRNSFNNANGGGILIKDVQTDVNNANDENIVNINYNTIEACANNIMSSFTISKIYNFNFDHNTIKDCIIHGYSCQINLENNIHFFDEYTLRNLTLIGCESNSKTGGGLGIWLTFKASEKIGMHNVRKGKFTLENCQLINNSAGNKVSEGSADGPTTVGGSGGAFQSGNTSLAWTDITVKGCTFIGNRAEFFGGALSITSTKVVIIENCTFTNNYAKAGGGAIYIMPHEYKHHRNNEILFTLPQMEECTISNCIFENNKDSSANKCHAIYFQYYTNAETIFTINNNCKFKDNCDENGRGYTIISGAPTFIFEDSIIEFTDESRTKATAGLKVNESTTQLTINNIQFINNKGALELNSIQDFAIIEGCIFTNNERTDAKGGAIYVEHSKEQLTIKGCEFNSNSATEGNAIYITKTESNEPNGEFILQGSYFNNNVNKDIVNTQYMIVLEISSLEISKVEFTCEGDKIAYPILFKSTDKIQDIYFDQVISTYSGILVIPSELSEITFDNLTFYDCKCVEYIIEVSNSKINFNNTNITFSNRDEACGGIRIHTKGEINIENSFFISTKSATGAICYSPSSTETTSDNSLIINKCIFNKNAGGGLYINTQSGSTESITIQRNEFNECSIYENKFTTIGSSLTTDSIQLNISNNLFKNSIGESNRYIYSISLQSDSSSNPILSGYLMFEGNTIEFDDYSQSNVFLNIAMNKREFVVDNCTFSKCGIISIDKPWCNTILANLLSKLTISKCVFFECGNIEGETNMGGNVIGILNSGECIIQNCIFNFTSAAISSYIESTSFIGNILYKVGKNAFRISADKSSRGFEFMDNIITDSNRGVIIHSWGNQLKYEPIIRNNTFKRILAPYAIDAEKDEKIYAFKIYVSENIPITFDNSTFSDITTSQGGFGGYFNTKTPSINTNLQLSFINCNFEYSKQTTDESRNGNGGAIHMTNEYNLGKISLRFVECHFNSNSAEGNGGALSLLTDKDVVIEYCVFESNKAVVGKGGAIYIEEVGGQLIIQDCKFNGNSATEGNSIYGIDTIGELILQESNFNTNVNKDTTETSTQYMIVLEIGSLEISNVEFTCEGDKIAYPILFKSADAIENLIFNNVTSKYSALLYITEDNGNQEIKFNNLTFIDCKCEPYVIDSYISSISIERCNITFSIRDEACGAIRINNYGTNEIHNSEFSNTKSSSGTICYSPQTESPNDKIFTIESCQFKSCLGESVHISTIAGSLEEVNIKHNTFEECINIINRGINGINIGINTDSISLTIEGNTFNRCNNINTESVLISLDVSTSPVEGANKLFEFNNNTIYYEYGYNNDQQDPKGKLALRLYQPDREILIHNCTFTNCYKLEDEKPWANTISVNKLSKLTITQCHFYKCGYGFSSIDQIVTTNGGGNVIGISGSSATETEILNCIFDTTSTAVSSFVECITVINNTFNKCGRNTFRVTSENRKESKGFELINNKFLNSTSGCAIHVWISFGANSAISTCPTICGNIFEHNRIENGYSDESNNMFLFKLGQMNTIVFDNNTFRDIQTSKGGFAGKFECSSDSVNLTFVNCLFEEHLQTTNGGAFCSSNEYNGGNIYLTFERCQFNNNEVDVKGGALFIDINLDAYISQCKFVSNKASKTSSEDGFSSTIYISKVQKVTIENCEFLSNSGGVLISELVNSAIVEECNFFDNYCSNIYDFVISISNQNSKILNNIINFTNNTNSIRAIGVNKHGEIEITNNKIIKAKGSGALYITDSTNDGYTDKCLIFNYNLIEDFYNIKLGVFIIYKIYDFNIDHNIIKNCKIDDHLSEIDIFKNQYYSISFTWTNLTLIGCSSDVVSGGSLGCWIIFNNKNGTLRLQDCHFENNHAKHENGGGAFQSGCASVGNMALYFNNCEFINNSANLGGALSIQSGREAVIYNCIFINNIANNGGGAIYIHPSYTPIYTYLVPDTSIAKCRFESNQDSSDKGHAIYFQFDFNCQSIVEIKDDCYFINNGNSTSNGFAISSDAPELTISNIIIEFDSIASASGLLVESHTLNANIQHCKFINTASTNGGAIQALNIECPITIFDCTFECNAVDKNASALYITTQNQLFNDFEINVKLCNFSSNLCSDGISLLYINNNCNLIVNDCFFHKNTVNQIIHVNPITELTSTTISNCYFDSQVMKSESYAIQIITGKVLVDSCSFIYDSFNFFNNGGIYLGNYCFSTYNCQFINTTTTSAIVFKQTIENDNSNKLINCTFNNCRYQNTVCFDIAVFSLIEMKNITIENIFQQNVESYFGQIKSSSNSLYLNEVIIEEISFVNNACDNLYGGGSGLMILSEKVIFKQCRFINNVAIKSNTKQRPQPDGIVDAYCNGDGGGIQWGYSQLTFNTEIEFIECSFIDNKANRHGGAIAIQTLKTVSIINCAFESNIADYKEETSGSEILSYENHYLKKKQGRGGAIYINPTFSYLIDGQIYPSNNEHLTSILIENCTFLNNQAFDGFAIYIEGDEPENNFQVSIVKNVFTNNKQINGNDDVNKSYRCIIASEVTLSHSEIKDQNIFNSEITPKISLVDHFGNIIIIYPIGIPSDESISLSSSDEIEYSETESMISETQSASLTISPSEDIEYSMTNETESITQTITFTEEIENSATESMSLSISSTEEIENSTTESISQSLTSSEEIENSTTESISQSLTSSEEIENSTTESISQSLTSSEEIENSITESISQSLTSSEEIENSITESITSVTQSFSDSSLSIIASFTEFTNSNLNGPFIGGNNKKKGLSMGAIIGIVCGIVIAVVIVVSVIVFLFIHKKKNVLKNSFHADELSIKNETRSSKTLSQRDDEDVDLDFWL